MGRGQKLLVMQLLARWSGKSRQLHPLRAAVDPAFGGADAFSHPEAMTSLEINMHFGSHSGLAAGLVKHNAVFRRDGGVVIGMN